MPFPLFPVATIALGKRAVRVRVRVRELAEISHFPLRVRIRILVLKGIVIFNFFYQIRIDCVTPTGRHEYKITNSKA